MSIELALSVLGLAVIALAIPLSLAIYYGARASDRRDLADTSAATATRAQATAELVRDQEHAARVAAEAAVADLTAQIAATQAALNFISKEKLDVIHQAITSGDSAAAIAAIRSVWSHVPAAPAGPVASASGGSGAPAVQPAAAGSSGDVAKPDPV